MHLHWLQQELFTPQWSTTGPANHFLKILLGPVPVSNQSLRVKTIATQDHAIPYQQSTELPDLPKSLCQCKGQGVFHELESISGSFLY